MDRKDLNALRYCACFRLRAAARKVTRDYEVALKPTGLRATQFSLLAMIMGIEPNSLTTLAEEIGMDRTALNRALNIMVKHGWVTVTGSSDSLEKKIRITKSGIAKLEEALPLWQSVQDAFIRQCGEDSWPDNRNWLIEIAGGNTLSTSTTA